MAHWIPSVAVSSAVGVAAAAAVITMSVCYVRPAFDALLLHATCCVLAKFVASVFCADTRKNLSFVQFFAPLFSLCLNNTLLIYLYLFFWFLISISFSFFVIVSRSLHPFALPTHLTTLAAFIGILFTFHLCNFLMGERDGGTEGGKRTKTVSIMSVKSMNRNCFRQNLLIISQKLRKMKKQKINRRNLQMHSKIPCALTMTNKFRVPKDKEFCHLLQSHWNDCKN